MQIVGYDPKYDTEILELVKEFHDESLKEYETKLDMETITKQINIYKDTGYLLIQENRCVGLMAGMPVNSPVNNEKVYQEIMWYVKKADRKSGVFMLREIERILKASGYAYIIMALVHNSKAEKLHKFYTRMGYKPIETHFMRRL